MGYFASLAIAILELAACGGGESADTKSSVPTTTTTAPPSSTTTDDSEMAFSDDDALLAIDAYFAAYGAGEGIINTPPDCDVADGPTISAKNVVCDFDLLNAPTQTVDAVPVSTTIIAIVTLDGIGRLSYSFEPPDPLHVGPRFNQWIADNHPEAVEATAFGNWTTVDEARQTGELRSKLAQEWAAYLEANDCSYLDGC